MRSYVLITGAAGGPGKAFAAECASRGWDLFLTDLRRDALSRVARGVARLHNVEALTWPCDLSDPGSRHALWDHIHQEVFRLHLLINVAGLDHEGPFIERRLEELRGILRVNIEGTVEMIWQALRYRDPSRTLRIINVSSLAGFYPMPLKATYAASKRFLLDLSLALNEELRGSNATVTALCPAGMPTTADCIDRIGVQGVMGQITTMNVGDMVQGTLRSAFAGRSAYIPGLTNRALRALGTLVPAPLVARLIGNRWERRRARLGPGDGTLPSLVEPTSAEGPATA